MAKQTWKAGNMLYPLPAVMVSVTDGKGQDDIITVAWTGTICTNPPMVYISVVSALAETFINSKKLYLQYKRQILSKNI